MIESQFGMPYCKINSLWKRDAAKKNIVIPGAFSQFEFEYLYGLPWRWTEKIDGTNIRIHWNGTTVTLGGRTDNAQIPAHLVAALAPYTDPEIWQRRFPAAGAALGEEVFPSVTLYGEGFGPKIQKGGGLYRDDAGFILFDVRIGRTWLRPDSVKEIADGFGLETVPEMPSWTLQEAWGRTYSNGYESKWASRGVAIEGLVGTPQVPLLTRMGERVITKMKLVDAENLRRFG
jgi:hypothetical protein